MRSSSSRKAGYRTDDDVILATAFVTVGLSVLAHGVTAAPLASRYANWLGANRAAALAPVEAAEGKELRWRLSHARPTAEEPG